MDKAKKNKYAGDSACNTFQLDASAETLKQQPGENLATLICQNVARSEMGKECRSPAFWIAGKTWMLAEPKWTEVWHEDGKCHWLLPSRGQRLSGRFGDMLISVVKSRSGIVTP